MSVRTCWTSGPQRRSSWWTSTTWNKSWAVDRTCRDLTSLRRSAPGLTVGVNLFGTQFRDGRFAADVRDVLERVGLPPQALELEITENIILRRDDAVLGALKELRSLGVGVAFDDFGTGFASLSRVKIDRGFVAGIRTDPVDTAIVNVTIHIANAMGIDVVGEGVDPRHQAVVVLSVAEVEERQFGRWAMAHRLPTDSADTLDAKLVMLLRDAPENIRQTFLGLVAARRDS